MPFKDCSKFSAAVAATSLSANWQLVDWRLHLFRAVRRLRRNTSVDMRTTDKQKYTFVIMLLKEMIHNANIRKTCRWNYTHTDVRWLCESNVRIMMMMDMIHGSSWTCYEMMIPWAQRKKAKACVYKILLKYISVLKKKTTTFSRLRRPEISVTILPLITHMEHATPYFLHEDWWKFTDDMSNENFKWPHH